MATVGQKPCEPEQSEPKGFPPDVTDVYKELQEINSKLKVINGNYEKLRAPLIQYPLYVLQFL